MMRKKHVFILGGLLCVALVIFNASRLKIAFLKGKPVAFSLGDKPRSPKTKTLLIVGSEGTVNTQLPNKIAKICPHLTIQIKVNRYTDLKWQEANELHGLMRQGTFDFVLIEAQSSDFDARNKDLIARFQTTGKKAASKIFYWSRESVAHPPPHFLEDLSTLKKNICP